MPKTLPLLNEDITYSAAQEREANILHQLGYPHERTRFFAHLNSKHAWIKAIVTHHLGLSSIDVCRVADMKDWFCGSFNVSVPVIIQGCKGKQQPGHCVLLRFPLPYRVGEKFRRGNGDEKIRSEAGAYAWLQENCPDVPIPRLYGFGLSTGEKFTRADNLPLFGRIFHFLRRRLSSWLGFPVPSYYIRHLDKAPASLDGVIGTGYLLIEKIEETRGSMLSNTWLEKQHDINLRTNFFRDLSRILLSISRIPLPQIGSFSIDSGGFLRLSNRPLSMEIQELENENISVDIPRDRTYSSVESYVADILCAHDSRLRDQPNAVNNIPDCGYQMSALAAMRMITPLVFRRDFRRGPFIFTLTDIHQSNIFVDESWHITCLVDLEWACSRPIEMVDPPYWLTNKGVDEINAEEYNLLRTELMTILADEEAKLSSPTVSLEAGTMPRLSEVMQEAWTKGTFWYTLALSSPTGLFSLFYDHIQPLFSKTCSEEFGDVMPFYWERDAEKFVAKKISDRQKYDRELQLAFKECMGTEASNTLS
ncbi:hypothetical protein BDV36DRAFT_298674 [Aspergillus pseudocaelatus]|uniref:Aminoglycoside phosphotransferase domain-containing protein n=1 Tax=Aspergillus pseudocaelatus TaxID=1825620 RepID=A0ABQ6WCJ4_9EURO|nr:hypothetical protein BDV36DRAFT_298674 [Aspergillus pseudocaelatus]